MKTHTDICILMWIYMTSEQMSRNSSIHITIYTELTNVARDSNNKYTNTHIHRRLQAHADSQTRRGADRRKETNWQLRHMTMQRFTNAKSSNHLDIENIKSNELLWQYYYERIAQALFGSYVTRNIFTATGWICIVSRICLKNHELAAP